MTNELEKIEMEGRRAVQARDWVTVYACASKLLADDKESAEGHFLTGLVHKSARRRKMAKRAFERVLEIDPARYDAAVELANLYAIAQRNDDAVELLNSYIIFLRNSPRYLDLAATVYSDLGMVEQAWPLYLRANEVQPGVDLFQANLANCAVYLGKIDDAKLIYRTLLERYPAHQQNHYHLSRLEKAQDSTHIEQMLELVRTSTLRPDQLIYLYYAIGKEYEDLEQWDNAFRYYSDAGNAITKLSEYDLTKDIDLIDTVIEVCTTSWLAKEPLTEPKTASGRTPVFIVGLPRTGTTLTERIVASHSKVGSLGETQFIQRVIRRSSGVTTTERMIPAIIRAMAENDSALIAEGYMHAVAHRLGDEPMFIDKMPMNLLHLGFIAKAFPNARIIHLQRHPLDACLAMYKQVFTWAYKFSYTLDGLGGYYIAYNRLLNHWRDVLGDRLIEVRYEDLVTNQETVTRRLLDQLGLEFEQACLDFEQNPTASTTASSVQVRDKIHTGSIEKWRHFEKHLLPLQQQLEKAGILPA